MAVDTPSPADIQASRPNAMTPAQVAIVKSTAPILKEQGVAITSHFYASMLAAHPSLHNIFNRANQATGDQPRALAAMVFAFASHADDLAALEAGIHRVAHKHVSLQVQPGHYSVVGQFLIASVAKVLGPEIVTAAVADAWTAAYAVLADIFIRVEADLYKNNQDRVDPVTGDKVWPTVSSRTADSTGAESGWRPFVIQRRVDEAADRGIVSFYLVPKDDDPSSSCDKKKKKKKNSLPSFMPGQYISVRVPVPELGGVLQPRQYSLSDSPGKEYYRISVKRQVASSGSSSHSYLHSPAGLVSNLLHDKYQVGDVIEVTHPMGEFHVPSYVGVQPKSSSLSSLPSSSLKTNGSGDVDSTSISTSINSVQTATSAAGSSNKKPMVLISAGVGVTPMISILNAALSTAAADRESTTLGPISWVHGAHDVSARAFHEHVSEAAAAHPDVIEAHLFVTATETADGAARPEPQQHQSSSSPAPPSQPSNIHTYTGRIDLSLLPQTSPSSSSSSLSPAEGGARGGLYLDDATTEYLVCGPRSFMDSVHEYLVVQNGVDETRVLREVFGTGN